jgi:hypothetical protein
MTTQLGSTPLVISQGAFVASTTQQHVLGEKAVSSDGRTFRYVKAGAAALVPGNVIQSPAIIANHVNLTPTAAVAVGATSVTVTLGATAVTANQYSGGYLTVEIGTTGAGQTLLIDSHPAALSGATLTLKLSDPFVTATSGTVTMSLVRNNYDGVIQTPVTTLTGTPVGVALFAIPAGSFGWIVSRGITGVLADGAITVGTVACAVPSAAAGAAKVMAATLFPIGTFCKTTITTQVTPCYVSLD